MKIHNCEQKTDEWFYIRKLKMTASKADVILTNGKGLETYCMELVTDFLADAPRENYTNPDIERGNLLENQARQYCSLLTGIDWSEVGFVEMDEFWGLSPDGVVFDGDKIINSIEIKCHSDRVFLELLLKEKIDPKYMAQMQMQMLGLGTPSCIYFAYNTNIYPYYFMREVKADKDMQSRLQIGLNRGKELIKNLMKEYQAKVGE